MPTILSAVAELLKQPDSHLSVRRQRAGVTVLRFDSSGGSIEVTMERLVFDALPDAARARIDRLAGGGA